MKKFWCIALLVLVFLATGICAAEVPDLRGKWISSWNGYDEGIGFVNSTAENESLIFIFAEQKGRLFAGNMTYMAENGTRISKDLAGAIGLDNKTLNLVEFDEGGYDVGTIISEDEMEMTHLDDGKTGDVAIDRLHRIKA
jgi:hypothetical protein